MRHVQSRLPSGIFAHHKDRRACRCTQHRPLAGAAVANEQHSPAAQPLQGAETLLKFKFHEAASMACVLGGPGAHGGADVTTFVALDSLETNAARRLATDIEEMEK